MLTWNVSIENQFSLIGPVYHCRCHFTSTPCPHCRTKTKTLFGAIIMIGTSLTWHNDIQSIWILLGLRYDWIGANLLEFFFYCYLFRFVYFIYFFGRTPTHFAILFSFRRYVHFNFMIYVFGSLLLLQYIFLFFSLWDFNYLFFPSRISLL